MGYGECLGWGSCTDRTQGYYISGLWKAVESSGPDSALTVQGLLCTEWWPFPLEAYSMRKRSEIARVWAQPFERSGRPWTTRTIYEVIARHVGGGHVTEDHLLRRKLIKNPLLLWTVGQQDVGTCSKSRSSNFEQFDGAVARTNDTSRKLISGEEDS